MKKLRKMTQQEVDEMCKKHEAWLENRADGVRADFSGASLKGMSLKNADLRFANLEGADLRLVRATYATFDDCTANGACFTEAQLTGASFEGASLQSASFECAIINFVSFAEADLRRANFIDAMTGGTKFAAAKIDFAAFNSGIAGDCYDDKQIAEVAYHLCSAVLGGHTNSPEVKAEVRKILSLANRAESVTAFGRVQEYKKGKYITAKEAE